MQDYPGLKDAIAVTLRKLREAENLSKRQMAEKALLERVYLIQLERGQKRPSVNALFYLSSALGIKASEMIQKIEEEMEKNGREIDGL
ncbi:MAG: helix-turn-helix transcriptional regulator [Desulfovibrio sp.]|nr:helix-turn-helix transcriptional regulator [Desulfovibrio sp.]